MVAAGLNSAADALGDERKSASALYAFEVGRGDPDGTQVRFFALLAEAIGNPKRQTFIMCSPWAEDESGPVDATADAHLAFPFLLRFSDRRMVLPDPRGTR